MDEYDKQFYIDHQNDRIGITEYRLKDLPQWARNAYYQDYKKTHQLNSSPQKQQPPIITN